MGGTCVLVERRVCLHRTRTPSNGWKGSRLRGYRLAGGSRDLLRGRAILWLNPWWLSLSVWADLLTHKAHEHRGRGPLNCDAAGISWYVLAVVALGGLLLFPTDAKAKQS